jgi:tRNA pseudouridine13 synthase
LMFIHAYQSFLFNRILSTRIAQGYSLAVTELGDRILPVDKAGLPDHGDGILVTEANQKKLNMKIGQNKAFISGLVVGSKTEFAQGVQGEIEQKIVEDELGSLDVSRFIVPEIPRLTTKGTRREMLAYVSNASIEQDGEDALLMKFDLNKGCYATTLLREFFKK